MSQASARGGRHVTAIVVASAAGDVLPPFSVFAGKYQAWFDALPAEIFKDSTGEPHWIAKNWLFPENSCIVGSEIGSMNEGVDPHFSRTYQHKHSQNYAS